MINFLKKHVWLFILVFLAALFPESLSDQAKLNMRVIITGIGIDYSDDKYNITSQVVLPQNGSESGGISAHTTYVKADGETISEALHQVSYKLGKVAEFSHVEFVLIGESMRQFNLAGSLDYLFRNFKLKNSVMLLCCQGEAGETIKKTSSLELSVALSLQKVYQTGESTLNATSRTYADFVIDSNTLSGTCVLDTLEITNGEEESGSGGSGGSGGGESSEGSGGSGDSSGGSSSGGGSGGDGGGGQQSSGGGEQSSGGGSSSGASNGGSGGQQNSSSGASGGNLQPISPLQLFKNGKFSGIIEDEDMVLGYYYAASKAKMGNLSVTDFSYGETLNANINIRLDKIGRSHKIEFVDKKPKHIINVKISEIKIDEIANEFYNNVKTYDRLNKDFQDAILQKAAEKIKGYIYSLFNNCQTMQYDIFKTANFANAFKPGQWEQFYSSLNGQDYMQYVTLEVNVDFGRID